MICLCIEIFFSDFYVQILVYGLITFNLPSCVSVLEKQYADLAFFCRVWKAIPESINISYHSWETDTKLSEKNGCPALLLLFSRESVINHVNNCLGFFHYVNKVGVKCHFFLISISTILGNNCTLEKKASYPAVQGWCPLHTYIHTHTWCWFLKLSACVHKER